MKLPLMLLLSIKTKSYRRLHCTHYKQVILKDSQVLGSQSKAAGWVGTRTRKGELKKWIRLQSSVLHNSRIPISGLSRDSRSPSFPIPLRHLVSSVVDHMRAHTKFHTTSASASLPPFRIMRNGAHEQNSGLHSFRWTHAPFTLHQRNTSAALVHFEKILARKKRVAWIFQRDTPFSDFKSFNKKRSGIIGVNGLTDGTRCILCSLQTWKQQQPWIPGFWIAQTTHPTSTA